MNGFKPRFASVKGLSEKRRLPRLGKIRLGIKKKSVKSGKEYPSEVSYFVCPPEVERVYGAEPKELDVMFPVNDQEAIFPQAYKYYGSSKGLKCIGNGEEAQYRNDDGSWVDKKCPCELYDQNKCQIRGHLQCILPKVSVGGVYQIDTGSFNSIQDVNSGLAYIQAMVGRFSMIPCKLKRLPRETHGSGKKETHYTLNLHLDADINSIEGLRKDSMRILTGTQYALPEPEDINPAMDDQSPVEFIDEENDVPDEVTDVTVEDFADAEMPPVEDPTPITKRTTNRLVMVMGKKGIFSQEDQIVTVGAMFNLKLKALSDLTEEQGQTAIQTISEEE
jgi:hypothetical protein